MKKRKWLAAIFISVVTISFFLLFMWRSNMLSTWRSNIAYSWNTLPIVSSAGAEKVLSYQLEIEEELKKYDLEDYAAIILAIMYQESKGEGTDPMQSSESAGLARNEIQDASESIQQGIYHFYQMYKIGKEKGVDMATIIQSYNMGPGYIAFVAENGFRHSEDLAKEYSKKQVERNPELYGCGSAENFRHPYCYGDFAYVTKVNSKIAIFEEKIAKS